MLLHGFVKEVETDVLATINVTQVSTDKWKVSVRRQHLINFHVRVPRWVHLDRIEVLSRQRLAVFVLSCIKPLPAVDVHRRHAAVTIIVA